MIASLTAFANLCMEGRVLSVIRPILYGASLCALNKKDGGITPFAVGSTLRRLVARVASCQLVKELLAPAQLGFGIQVGDEAAAHAARSFLYNLTEGQALGYCKSTLATRSTLFDVTMLTVMNEKLPELFPLINSRYFEHSFLQFGHYMLFSDEGPQQGDPLGPLLFCLTVMALVKRSLSSLSATYGTWTMERWR